jgi:hypothetical protein
MCQELGRILGETNTALEFLQQTLDDGDSDGTNGDSTNSNSESQYNPCFEFFCFFFFGVDDIIEDFGCEWE